MERDIVERLQEYVKACEATQNGASRHCQDCRDAISEIESLRKEFLTRVTSILGTLGKVKNPEDIMQEINQRFTRNGL